MACLKLERFRLSATIAALSVLAVAQLFLSAPASAHTRSHHHYLARHAAAPAYAENSAQARQAPYQDSFSSAPAPDQESRSSFNDSASGQSSPVDGMAASAASAAGIPVSLVERVIKRESGGNPRAVSQGNYGLMQIRLGTARAMGYSGSAEGLLDAQTNMTYAVKYLAGAYRAAGGNENRAVALYASGYYEQAKAQGFSPYETARTNSGFGGYRHVADASQRYESPARLFTASESYNQPRYVRARYRAARPRYVEAGYGGSFAETRLYAYVPAYPAHYRVRHDRHHAA